MHELHPLCTLFPRLDGAEFAHLVEDIAANGLREPITLHDGMILDGGNRYRACIEAGVEPTFKTFDGSSIVAFVLSANLHRRHLSPGQQAAIVASAQDWAMAHPPHRKEAGNVTGLSTVADRAAQSGASEKTQRMADKVTRADPELGAAVARGEVSLPKAVKQVSPKKEPEPEPPPEDDPMDSMREALAEATADNEQMARIFEADDKLAAAVAEAKRYRELLAVSESRVQAQMREIAALKRENSMLRKKAKG